MGDFKQLEVWRRAHALTLKVYEVTSTFPKSEIYGLAQQLRRAAVSIEANLAEGCGRKTDRELTGLHQLPMVRLTRLRVNYWSLAISDT